MLNHGHRYLLGLLVALGWVLSGAYVTSCTRTDDHGETEQGTHAESEHDEAEGDLTEIRVAVPDEVLARFGVRLAPAGPGEVAVVRRLAGEVVPDPDRVQHVTPRYAGVVRKVLRHVGDRVRRGEILAWIEANETLTTYPLRADVDGVITAEHIALGEVLEAGHEAYTITDTRRVWVVLQLFPEQLLEVAPGQRVTLHSIAGSVTARIDFVQPVLDHATRTGAARVVLDAPAGRWWPGLFVTAHVEVARERVPLAVPDTALVRHDEDWAVIVRDPDGRFGLRPIQLGRTGPEASEVVAGLEPGEPIVVAGTFLIRSELAKAAGAIEAEHGH